LCDRLVLTQFLWFFRPAQYTLPAPAAYFFIILKDKRFFSNIQPFFIYFYTYLNDHIRSLFLLGILYHITNIRSNTIKNDPYIQ
jgi:hypothetical protein